MTVEVRHEHPRGCGYREPGGNYLVGPPFTGDCCLLPVPLHVCPTCHGGIKPSRGWTWVDATALLRNENPTCDSNDPGFACPLAAMHLGFVRRVGLLWVGGGFYPTPEDFLHEAEAMGVSKRIAAVPKGFEVGETWVLLAHRKVGRVVDMKPVVGPGIFAAFKPTAIEHIVTEETSAKDLAKLRKRELTPVIVKQLPEQMEIS